MNVKVLDLGLGNALDIIVGLMNKNIGNQVVCVFPVSVSDDRN